MNHLELFRLAQEPFANLPDVRFFFEGAGRAEALAQCQAALAEPRHTVLAEAGESMGKTMLARKLEDTADAEDGQRKAVHIFVPHARADAKMLLASVLRSLSAGKDITASDNASDLAGKVRQQIEKLGQSGIQTLLTVDEAQMLHDAQALDALLALLSSENGGEAPALSLLFLAEDGQGFGGTLRKALADRGLGEAHAVHLTPLTQSETAAYVARRLSAAGLAEGSPSPFSDDALKAVSELSGGAPGRINLLCEESLAEAARTKQKTVGANIVRQSAARLGLIPAGQKGWSPLPFSSSAESRLPDNLDEIDAFLGSLQAE